MGYLVKVNAVTNPRTKAYPDHPEPQLIETK
jgi:hypothetical protein